MIHLFEFLGFGLCVWLIVYFYKKVSRNPENKDIAIFSTVITTIHLLVSVSFYLNRFYDFLNILDDWWALIIGLVNPILFFSNFAYAIGMVLAQSQTIYIDEILRCYIAPILVSTLVCIWLSNIFARMVRWISLRN
jgi:predicted Na+-dependent transporter